MRIQIDKIKVNPGRREALPEHIEELAKSIAEVGLLNPITVDREYNLIAGLHRLEAAKRLGWTEIECTVSNLEGLQAELAEIDENFVRCELTAVEYGDLLLRRKEIYETLHPETRKGQRNGKTSLKSENTSLLRTKSFTQDTADKLGIVKRTVERQIQAAKNLTPEARAILLHSDISKENLLKISRLEPKLQCEAAKLFVSGKVKSMDDLLLEMTVSSVSPSPNKVPAAEPVIDKPKPLPPRTAEPSEQSRLEGSLVRSTQTSKETVERNCENVKIALPDEVEASPTPDDAAPDPPYSLGGVKYSTIRESVADLKNPDKDCSNTPDSFLAEITEFVHKFQQEISWFHIVDYEPVFPVLSQVQFEYFQRQMDELHDAVKQLFHHVQKGRDKNE